MPLRYHRKSPRLQGYDYAQNGLYFVTICTHQRAHLFGTIENDTMRLNDLGQIAELLWKDIPVHFPNVQLDAYVVMPNHVHGIIIINPPGLSKPYTPESFSRPVSGSLSTIVRSFKSAVTQQVNRVLDVDNSPVWQGRYHDHIIRDDASYAKIHEYVLANPARWHEDTFYSDANP